MTVLKASWTKYDERYGICQINKNDSYNISSRENLASFSTKLSLDEAVEFYERFTDDTAEIDKENQKIVVSGQLDNEIFKKLVTIDWKNRSISYTGVDGTKFYYDEKS